MLGGHRQEGDAKQGVRTGCEHADFAEAVLELEGDFRAFRATKPVLLEQGNVLWEVDGVQAVNQFLSVLGQVEEPLAHVFLDHRAVASPASARLDLLVGQHGGARFAPVDGRLFAVGQALFEELQEKPLVPPVVVRVVALHQAVPIVREAHPLDLSGDAGHVAFGDVVRMPALFDGRVFGRHAKGIETHGIQHIEAAHALVAGHGITDGVVADVPHVHLPRGVWVHLEAVEGRTVPLIGSNEHAFLVPAALPRHFIDANRFVAHGPSSGHPSRAMDLKPTA